jgi:hypothetical protein
MVRAIFNIPGKDRVLTRADTKSYKKTVKPPSGNKSDQLTYGHFTHGALYRLINYLRSPTKLDSRESLP